MTPEGNGRNCASCAFVVEDLSHVPDNMLIERIEARTLPKCARFSVAQLNRVLSAAALPIAGTLPLMAGTAPSDQPTVVPDFLFVEPVQMEPKEMQFLMGDVDQGPFLLGYSVSSCPSTGQPLVNGLEPDPRTEPLPDTVHASTPPAPPRQPEPPPKQPALLAVITRIRRYFTA